MRRLLPALALSGAVLLSGCAQDDGAPGAQGQDRAVPTPIESAAAEPGAVVLQVAQTGGFQLVGADFARPPELTVYGDGRAIVTVDAPASAELPAVPELRTHQLDDDRLDALNGLAEQAGLLAAPADHGRSNIADASTTVVTVQAGGTTRRHEVYALGSDPGSGGFGQPTGDDAATEAARARVAEFLDRARALVERAPATGRYEPAAYAVFARPEPARADATPLSWPVPAVDLAAGQDCVVLAGAAADALRKVLPQTTASTLFSAGGETYRVPVRPLLPGETGC